MQVLEYCTFSSIYLLAIYYSVVDAGALAPQVLIPIMMYLEYLDYLALMPCNQVPSTYLHNLCNFHQSNKPSALHFNFQFTRYRYSSTHLPKQNNLHVPITIPKCIRSHFLIEGFPIILTVSNVLASHDVVDQPNKQIDN